MLQLDSKVSGGAHNPVTPLWLPLVPPAPSCLWEEGGLVGGGVRR